MKVLFISESVWMAGVVYDLHMLAEGLSLLGHEVFALDPGVQTEEAYGTLPRSKIQKVSRVFPEASVKLFSPNLSKPPFKFFKIDDSRTVRRIYRYFKIAAEIKQFLKETTIDIIVLYSALRSGRQAALLANKFEIPIVFRNVDMLHKLLPTALDRILAKRLEKTVYPRMDKLLALTPKYADYLIELGADRSKVELLLFPIDLKQFQPSIDTSDICQTWGIEPKDKLIVFMGVIYEFSGIVEFTRRFPSVLDKIPEAKLIIVGDGPLLPDLEKIIEELKISGRVVITGYQPFSLMPQFINAATICLNVFPLNNTTRNLFSAKIIQFLSCQKATVSTSLPGITTLIKEKACGVIYADTIEGLNQEIIKLMKSPEERKNLEVSGRTYVAEFHSHHRIIEKLEKVLKDTLIMKNN